MADQRLIVGQERNCWTGARLSDRSANVGQEGKWSDRRRECWTGEEAPSGKLILSGVVVGPALGEATRRPHGLGRYLPGT